MKRGRITALLSFVIVLSVAKTSFASNFSDIDGHWANQYIKNTEVRNIIQGYPDGTFRPDNPVTRGEYYRMINQSLGATKTEADIKFTDITNSDWYYEEVKKAVAMGYLENSARSLKANEPIPREEAFSITGDIYGFSNEKEALKFKDAKNIKSTYIEAIGGAKEKGIVEGYPDGTFHPKENLTRAEAAAAGYRAYEKYGEPKQTEASKGVITFEVYEDITEQKKVTNFAMTIYDSSEGIVDTPIINGKITLPKGTYKYKLEKNGLRKQGTFQVQGDAEIKIYLTEKDGYTVTFIYNDATTENKHITAQKNNPVGEPSKPLRRGYVFSGWTTDKEGKSLYDFKKVVNQSFTLYGQWKPEEDVFEVSFDSTGGTLINSVMVQREGKLKKPIPSPIKEGATFGGWFTHPSGGEEFDFNNTKIMDHIVLYAKWIVNPPKTHTVSFDTGGGNELFPLLVKGGELLVPPEKPERVGYEFLGWFSDVEGVVPYNFSISVEKDVTLYAKWELKKAKNI